MNIQLIVLISEPSVTIMTEIYGSSFIISRACGPQLRARFVQVSLGVR